MASTTVPLNGGGFQTETLGFDTSLAKSIPILPSVAAPATGSDQAMDTSQSHSGSMDPPTTNGRDGEEANELTPTALNDSQESINGGGSQPVGAAAAAQQPKVVQTAFIHKLYNMLEDQSIQHLISWSSSNESFVMSPSSEFSKVLAQYFKHTNISSFVRQLNMYGFHKVSDVFHTGSPDSPLWEFKHGGGSFKRGDLVGLREIKRRASRHALIHRDSFSTSVSKMSTTLPPGTPMEQPMQEPIDTRLSMLEWNSQDVFARLSRTEEAYTAVTAKCQALLDGLSRCHQWNQQLCSHLMSVIDASSPTHEHVSAMRQDISRYMDQLKSLGDPQDPLFPSRQPFFQNNNLNMDLPIPLSPRQRPFDESRRPSLQATRTPSFRAPAAPQAPMSPRRYGSIGAGSGTFSPAYNRPTYLPPPPLPQTQQHPLANMTSPPPVNLARRHTSADIRVHGWQGGQPPSQYGQQGSSPFASGESSSAWPSSPRQSANPGDQQLRDALAQYDLPRASNTGSRQPSPPPSHDPGAPSFTSSFGGSYANTNDAGWQIPGARYPFKGLDASRRSSMASNVHSLLNPADTAEREGEDEGPDERKRKRVQ